MQGTFINRFGEEFTVEISDFKIIENKKTGYERAEKNDWYYFINESGAIEQYMEGNTYTDLYMYDNVNYYTNKKLAKNSARADHLMRQLRRFAAEHKRKNFNIKEKYTINYDGNKLYCCDNSFVDKAFGEIYFDSKEITDLAIDAFKNELIWYFKEYQNTF